MPLNPILPKLYTVIVDFSDSDKDELRYGICFDETSVNPFITDSWKKAKNHIEYLRTKTGYNKYFYFICELSHAPVRNQNRNNG